MSVEQGKDKKSIYVLLSGLKDAHLELESYLLVSDDGALNPEKFQDVMMDLRDKLRRAERALLVYLIPVHLGIGERDDVSYSMLGDLLQAIGRDLRS